MIQVKISLKKGLSSLFLGPTDGCVSMAVWELERPIRRCDQNKGCLSQNCSCYFILFFHIAPKINARCYQYSNKIIHLLLKYFFLHGKSSAWK